MNISPRTQRAVLASLKKITAEVEGIEVEQLEAPIPADLTAGEDFDLELDNANPMVAANEDEIESLELEEEKKDDIPEELKASGEEVVEKEQIQELENDPVVNVADIIKGADNDGNIRFSCIKALAGCDQTVIPDDKKDEDIQGSVKASLDKPGIEDKIGDEANGGDPSTSQLKDIIARCDNLAEYCKVNGMSVTAKHIDIISNTLDAELKNL